MIKTRFTAVFVLSLLASAAGLLEAQDRDAGLIENGPGAFQGYTLYGPIMSKTTCLVDMEGRVVHAWESEYDPGQSAYLLENGHLLRTANPGPGSNRTFHGGGSGGRVQEITWEGELVWDFEYSSEDHLLHHDIERMPNGNILMIAWERKMPREAVKAGRNPENLGSEGLWPDHVIEVKPTGKTTGKIVWEWHVWDHLIQDHDPKAANYGNVADHPELINLNPFDWSETLSKEERERLESLGYIGGSRGKKQRRGNPDWNHTNSIAYNPELDQIALSVLGFNEIWIIDHSTTIEEAAGHSGGRYGMGGDLLYRWGNPQAYKNGSAGDQRLFAQHDAHWIPPGFEGEGNLLVFNNGGRGRPGGSYSSVDEIVPPMNGMGGYAREAGKAFGPAKPAWSYTAPEKADFFSVHISGAQRLPNGNTLICSGEKGILFEVTREKEEVWKYINPLKGEMRPPPGRFGPGGMRPGGNRPGMNRPGRGGRGPGMDGPQNSVFRAYRYGPDYPGLEGKELKPRFVVLDGKEFEKVVSLKAKVEKLAGGMKFLEGPVWIPEDGCLLFSDIPADEIKKWQDGELSTFRKPSRSTNGNLLDEKGRLLSCEHGSRSVTRTGKDGKVETLADSYEGRKLNSPNDIAVRSDGTIWFTDPPYGLKRRQRELENNNVFCLHPKTGKLMIVADDFDRPNGLCLSPDGKKLYVADSGEPRHIRVFDVHPDGRLSGGEVFCRIDIGAPDGIRCDKDGRLWSSAGDGVQVFMPDGKLAGKILVPERPANLCFGGEDGDVLFITARTSLYSIEVKVSGHRLR